MYSVEKTIPEKENSRNQHSAVNNNFYFFISLPQLVAATRTMEELLFYINISG